MTRELVYSIASGFLCQERRTSFNYILGLKKLSFILPHVRFHLALAFSTSLRHIHSSLRSKYPEDKTLFALMNNDGMMFRSLYKYCNPQLYFLPQVHTLFLLLYFKTTIAHTEYFVL